MTSGTAVPDGNKIWYYTYSAARIEYNLCGSVIQTHTHLYPYSDDNLGSLKPIRTGFLFYSTLFDFFGHILLCTNWNGNREPGNGDFGTVEPGNDFSGSGNLPSIHYCTENVCLFPLPS